MADALDQALRDLSSLKPAPQQDQQAETEASGASPSAPPPPSSPRPVGGTTPSSKQSLGTAAGEVAVGAGIGLIRAPAVALGSIFDTANDIGMWAGDIASDQLRGTKAGEAVGSAARATLNFPLIKQTDQLIRSFDTDGDRTPDFGANLGGSDFGFNKAGNDLANDFTAEAGAFLTGYSAVRSVVSRGIPLAANAFKSGSLAQRLGAEAAVGAVADIAFVTAQEDNLSRIIEDHGALPEFLEFMSTDDGDGRLEQKLKGALEGAFLGTGLELAGEGLTAAARAYKALRAGNVKAADTAMAAASEALGAPPDVGQKRIKTSTVDGGKASVEEATKDRLDRAFARQRTLAKSALGRRAQAAGVELTAEEGREVVAKKASTGETRAAKGAATEAGRRAAEQGKNLQPLTREQLVNDANKALEIAGVEERLTAETVKTSADGRFVVSSKTKDRLRELGMADPFVTGREAVLGPGTIIFRGQDTAGNSRVAGAMTRKDFSEFSARIKALAQAGDTEAANIKGGKKGQFTFAHAGSTVDAAIMMRAAVDALPDDVKSVIRDQDLAKSVAGMRKAVGSDPKTALAFAQSIAPNPDDAAKALLVTRVLFEDSTRAVDDLTDFDWFLESPEAVEQALESIHQYTTLAALYAQHSSSAGLALRAIQIPNRDIYKANFGLDKSVKSGTDEFPLPRNRQELADWVRIWKALGDDPEGRLEWVSRKTYSLESGVKRLRQASVNLWTMSILSAPKTVTLNLLGPALIGGIRTFEKSSGAFLQAVLPSSKSPSQRMELLSQAADASRVYGALGVQTVTFATRALSNALQGRAMLQGLDDNVAAQAGRWASRAFKENKVLTGARNGAFDFDNRFAPVDPDVLEASGQTGAINAGAHALANYLNVVPRVFSRFNAGLDDFSSRMSAIGEAQFDALVEARKRGISPDETRRFVMEQVGQQFGELGDISDSSLRRRSLRTTLTDQVGNDRPDGTPGFTRRAANAVNDIRRSFPETRFILPVFSIPANGLGEGLRRVPFVGSLFSESIRELRGELGQAAQNEAYGRMLTGAALTLFGMQMARSGMLTGSGPEDPNDRAAWQGKYRPWSIRIGGQWVDYSRYDVINTLFAIPSELYDSTVYKAQDATFGQKVLFGVGAVAELMRDRAALQTMSDFFNIGEGGTGQLEANWRRFSNNLVSGYVPNFVTTVFTDPTDPILREASNPWEAVLKKLPMSSTKLDPIYDTFGNPVYKPRDTLLEGVLPITLTDDVSWEEKPASNELHRLYAMTGYGAGLRRPEHIDNGDFRAEAVKLEDGRSMWSTYMGMRKTVALEGKTLEQAVEALVTSQRYQRAVDAGPEARPDGGRESRGKLIADLFSDYNKEIKRQLALQSPLARRYLALSKAKQDDAGTMATYSVDELAENEDILNALGINIAAYERKVTGQ